MCNVAQSKTSIIMNKIIKKSILEFKIDYSKMDPRTGKGIITTIVKITKKSNSWRMKKETIGSINGFLTYKDQIEFNEVYL